MLLIVSIIILYRYYIIHKKIEYDNITYINMADVDGFGVVPPFRTLQR